MPVAIISEAIDRLLDGEDIGREGAAGALEAIMSGEAGDIQTAGFLVALRAKGETAEEIAGLASVVRQHATPVTPPDGPFIDTCGTGGGRSTFNISTTAAFVVAGAGVAVAKHGNRSATSKCGSADVLEALGARIELDPDHVLRCLEEVGIGFMFAPAHHPSFRHIVPVRRALAVRTVFNLIGPLANPAGAPRQWLGVADPDYVARLAEALAALGAERALVVRGRDGLDELSTAAVNDVIGVTPDGVRASTIDPTEFGFQPPERIPEGGDPAENAALTRAVLDGDEGPARDVVLLNAAAALWLAGAAEDVADGVERAAASIDQGHAAERLDAFVGVTRRLATT